MTARVSSHRLREARLAAGLVQREVGERLGVSSPLVSQWETGATSPAPWRVPLLARLLGVEPHELFDPGAVLSNEDLGLLTPGQIVELEAVSEPVAIEIRVSGPEPEPAPDGAPRGPRLAPRASSIISPATGVQLDYRFANRRLGSSVTQHRRPVGSLPDGT